MKRGRFPQRIKRNSCVVTIYRSPNKGYDSFTVAHYDISGKFCRRAFADYAEALSAAEATVEHLAGSKTETYELTGLDLMIYRRAIEALQDHGVPLDVAAVQYVRSLENGNGSTVKVAPVDNEATVQAVSVGTVVDELLASKKTKGRSHLYLTDLRIRLTRFAKALDRPLCEVTTHDIDSFLESLGISARSQNNFRAAIGTLFRFGQAKGYVPRDHPGVSHVDKASHTAEEIQVFTPEEIEALLGAAKPELVPALAIGAFAGIRSEELKRLTWEDIHLAQGHIEIRSAKSKTKVRRLIPIQDNLKAWLTLRAADVGPVLPFANLALQFDKLAKRARVKWKKNGLRHSFISYRTAMTNNIPMVSLEAGNSPAVISRNYLKCVSASDARRWFGVSPGRTLRGSAAPVPHRDPTPRKRGSTGGWRPTRTGSRSLAAGLAQSERSDGRSRRLPDELVPAGGVDPIADRTMPGQTLGRDS